MLEYLIDLINADSLAPHGYCLLWKPGLIWTHVLSDAAIGLAYFSIPFVLARFLRKRPDIRFGWIGWMFAIFITACGITHFFAILTLWQPYYGVEAIIKAATAIASVGTAIALWRLFPIAVALPSPAQLERAHHQALALLQERDLALEALRRETEERLQTESMLRHSQKLESVGQLSGGIAHDFNNMLTVVLSSIDKSNRLAKNEPELLRALQHAKEAAQKCADLTDRLLSFARKQPLQPKKRNPNEIVQGTLELVRRTFPPDIQITADLSPEIWEINIDGNQLESALLNLALNAQHAMPDGGSLLLLTRNVSHNGPAPGDWVEISVVDAGCGMSKEVQARAFEPFFTTRPVGEGSGLGLSQVYGFMRQSEGHVLIESEVGRGTRVRLFIPRQPDI